MSAHCCAPAEPAVDPRFRQALWIALIINAAMFLIEISASFGAGSVSLLADSIDFFGDAANYAVSLVVLGMAATVPSRTSILKAACMGAFGVFVLARAAWAVSTGVVPEPALMGAIGALALAANVGVALLLYRHRTGDSNARSAWICSRNDAFGNVAVILAALGVYGTGSAWPDLGVAALMAVLAISGAATVLRQAQGELREARAHQRGTGLRDS
ncbi:MAG: cation transporter [Pseudomonadota bacterium]